MNDNHSQVSSGKLSLVNSSSIKIQIKKLAEKNLTGRKLSKKSYSAVGSSPFFMKLFLEFY